MDQFDFLWGWCPLCLAGRCWTESCIHMHQRRAYAAGWRQYGALLAARGWRR